MSAFLQSGRSDAPKSTKSKVRFRPEAVKGDDVDERFHSLLFHLQLHSICQEPIRVVYDVATDHCHYNFCSQKFLGFDSRDVF